jgi:hypothetical protein
LAKVTNETKKNITTLRYLVYTDLGGVFFDLTQTKQLQMLIGKCKLLEGAKLSCKMKAKDCSFGWWLMAGADLF